MNPKTKALLVKHSKPKRAYPIYHTPSRHGAYQAKQSPMVLGPALSSRTTPSCSFLEGTPPSSNPGPSSPGFRLYLYSTCRAASFRRTCNYSTKLLSPSAWLPDRPQVSLSAAEMPSRPLAMSSITSSSPPPVTSSSTTIASSPATWPGG